MLGLIIEKWEELLAFQEIGGDVLVAILVVLFLMWLLIVERMWYMRFVHPGEAKRAIGQWTARADRASWYAEHIRLLELSELSRRIHRSLPTIKTLIALCPLLGLLGTVTGMIEVFDVMALVGSGNARAMASGVYKATLPTMAGMVAALSGMYFAARLDSKARSNMGHLEDSMEIERG